MLLALGPIVILGVIWVPEIARHYVSGTTLVQDRLEEDRYRVSDAVLEEIRAYRLLPRKWKNQDELLSVADKLLQGRAEVAGFEPIEIRLPFDSRDLTKGSALWQLQFAGLIVPEILIDAYRKTGREEYFATARDSILAFGDFERRAWFDQGFLWNDHAVAARARTISDFWAIYRHRPDFSLQTASAIWRFATRTEKMLAKPSNYTFATNHGVMQNLALWHLCIAFPSLQDCSEDTQLALRRLNEEIAFYVGPDGVILEHSAEYHEFGTFLLGVALRYATLLNLQIPQDWKTKYELAKDFYREIRRPDGSLPMFGDTGDGADIDGIPITVAEPGTGFSALNPVKNWRPRNSFQVYPVSGYSVQWDDLEAWPATDGLAQTVLLASFFRGHGHKHADELSVLFWAHGRNWWTNSGYWSYEDPDRIHAESWEGSNAPHLAGEGADSFRRSSIVGSAQADRISAAEGERRGPGDFVARRLLVHISPDVWIVADSYSGGQKSVQTLWTTAAGTRVEHGAVENEYALTPENGEALRVAFFGGTGLRLSRYRGSHAPFAGWVISHGSSQPVEAFLIEQATEQGYAFSVWRLVPQRAEASAKTDPIAFAPERLSETSWSIQVQSSVGTLTVLRQGEDISVKVGGASSSTRWQVSLVRPSLGVANEVALLEKAYQQTAAHYPEHRDLMKYRERASLGVLALFVLQELCLIAMASRLHKIKAAAQILVVISWTIVGIWLHWVYLARS